MLAFLYEEKTAGFNLAVKNMEEKFPLPEVMLLLCAVMWCRVVQPALRLDNLCGG